MSLTVDAAWQWLMTPISGANSHHVDPWVMWHARVMVFAWAVLIPLGVIAARYFKVTPKQAWPKVVDNRAWWHAHRGLQYTGAALMLVGASLTWGQEVYASTSRTIHGYMGWCVVGIGALQVISAWLRGSKGGPTEPELRGDHYDMTPHRIWFERVHKFGGWFVSLLAIVTIVLGLVAADAPRWMPAVLVVWWIGLFAFMARLQRAGRCIDTYQAIWGCSTDHPGNHIKPTGWGVRRAPLIATTKESR